LEGAGMTRDEILNMPAGREMDALVAEKVMGLYKYYPGIAMDLSGIDGKVERVNYWWCKDLHNPHNTFVELKKYSVSISAAWEVVEKLKAGGWEFYLEWGTNPKPWVLFCHNPIEDISDSEADNITLAICRAALLAVLEEE
jgi:hypothetical protein